MFNACEVEIEGASEGVCVLKGAEGVWGWMFIEGSRGGGFLRLGSLGGGEFVFLGRWEMGD